MRRFLDESQIPDDRIPHVLGRGDDLAPNAMILQVIPDSLIGIEFGGVGREEEHTHPLLDGFALKERLHPLGLMGGVAVHNEKHHPACALNQPLDEVDKDPRAHLALDSHEPKLPLGTDGREHSEAEPGARGADYRRGPLRCPGGAAMMVRADTRFVAKEDLGLLLPRQAPDAGIVFCQPLLDRCRLLLRRSPDGPLWRQAQLIQEATHRRLAELDAESPVNHDANHVHRPQGKGKFQLQRILHRHGPVDPPERRGIQFRRPSPALLGRQCPPAALPIARQPAVDGDAIDAKHGGDGFGAFPRLHTLHRPAAQLCQRLMVQSAGIALHARRIAGNPIKVNTILRRLITVT